MQVANLFIVIASAIAAWFAADIAKFVLQRFRDGTVDVKIKIETPNGQRIDTSLSDQKSIDDLITRLRAVQATTEHGDSFAGSAGSSLDSQSLLIDKAGAWGPPIVIIVLAVIAAVYLSSRAIISWIILGLIAGFIAGKIVDTERQGHLLNIVLGIVGALVGGFLLDLFGTAALTGLNIWSTIFAIVGAVVVLLVYNAAAGRHRT